MVGRSLAAVQQQVSTRAASAWKAVREAASLMESGAFGVGSLSSSGLMMLIVCGDTGCCCGGCAGGICCAGHRLTQMQDANGCWHYAAMLHNTVCSALCDARTLRWIRRRHAARLQRAGCWYLDLVGVQALIGALSLQQLPQRHPKRIHIRLRVHARLEPSAHARSSCMCVANGEKAASVAVRGSTALRKLLTGGAGGSGAIKLAVHTRHTQSSP